MSNRKDPVFTGTESAQDDGADDEPPSASPTNGTPDTAPVGETLRTLAASASRVDLLVGLVAAVVPFLGMVLVDGGLLLLTAAVVVAANAERSTSRATGYGTPAVVGSFLGFAAGSVALAVALAAGAALGLVIP